MFWISFLVPIRVAVFPHSQQSIYRTLSLLLTLFLPNLRVQVFFLNLQLWFRDLKSNLHLCQLWMWPDPKTWDWGHCYCAPEIEWPLRCADSKGPSARGNNDGLHPFPLVLESAEGRWSVFTPSGLTSELIVSIDPLSSPRQAPKSPPQSKLAST